MTTFLVELFLDGYDDEEERAQAEEEFIDDMLNITASSVTVTRLRENEVALFRKALREAQ